MAIIASLSPHLTLAEFLGTSHRRYLEEQQRLWDTTPQLQEAGKRFAETVFEPTRGLVGPLHVNSGYRSPSLNAVVGGAPNSYHQSALAADVVPVRMSLVDAMRLISHGMQSGHLSAIDKVIIECNAWIHVQAARDGQIPRRLALKTDDTRNFSAFA